MSSRRCALRAQCSYILRLCNNCGCTLCAAWRPGMHKCHNYPRKQGLSQAPRRCKNPFRHASPHLGVCSVGLGWLGFTPFSPRQGGFHSHPARVHAVLRHSPLVCACVLPASLALGFSARVTGILISQSDGPLACAWLAWCRSPGRVGLVAAPASGVGGLRHKQSKDRMHTQCVHTQRLGGRRLDLPPQ